MYAPPRLKRALHRRGRSIGPGAAASLLALVVAYGAAPAGAQVTGFSPQGTVKQVRQAKARFAEPMVPFGDPRAAVAPFVAECAVDGTGQWIDSRNWIYDFERDLPAGLACSFRLRPGLKTLAGKPVGGRTTFAFTTGGPSIDWSMPNQGNERVDEEQAFVLFLDAEAKPESIVRHVSFAVEGIAEHVGVRLLVGDERQAVLDALPTWVEVKDRPIAVVRARQRFPNAARVRLVWGKGVESLGGVAGRVDQTLKFVTRPEFTAYVHCQRTKPDADCIPIKKIGLYFTAPVAWETARQVTLAVPGGKVLHPDEPETPSAFVQSAEFAGPFPESAELKIAIPAELRDDVGREILNRSAFPLTVATAPFPPLAKFAARFGIIESKADPALPVSLRNVEAELPAARGLVTREIPIEESSWTDGIQGLFDRVTGTTVELPPEKPEQILPWLRRLAVTRRDVALLQTGADVGQPRGASDRLPIEKFTLPKPSGPQELEVVGIPFRSAGLHIVELSSPRLGQVLLDKPRPMYVRAAALVTNLSVHFKWGRESSLAWVTTLDDASPVEKARVTVHDCTGHEVAAAETDKSGIARFAALPERSGLPNCYDGDAFEGWEAPDYEEYYGERALRSLDSGLLVVARTPDDLSFVHSSWMNGIEPWRFELPDQSWREPVVAHTILDRPLLRAGETVHMKHVLRAETAAGFALLSENERPTIATIRHLGSNETYDLPLAWDDKGLADGEWPIPRGAKLGRYSVVLRRLAAPTPAAGSATAQTSPAARAPITPAEWPSASFRVEEFRVPLMKATLGLPTDPQVRAASIPADLGIQYLAGGGAGGLPVLLRAQVRGYAFTGKDDLEPFTFANGPVREGVVRSSGEDEESDGGDPAGARPVELEQQKVVLDAAGTGRATIGGLSGARAAGLADAESVRELLAEAEFRDPNGEVQTVSATVPLWPAAWLVGIKAEHWAGTKDALRARAAVVDASGKAVEGAEVRIDVLERITYSNRKRLVGGFYGYEHVREVKAAGSLCTGRTDERGTLFCEAPPPRDGNLILQASITDEAGRKSTAHQDVWVSGESEWGFSVDATDRMDVLPEKHRYEPGDTARLQVRMPFRKATALITTEREGILDAEVRWLSGKDPVVELPVRGAHAPNVFVSVLAVRGRVAEPAPTAMIDLARPSFKLGIAEIRVGWGAHELDVAVSADRPVYQVRDKARIEIAVRTPDGDRPPAGSEVAIAAVDEGLLELEPNRSWNLLDALMHRRGYRLQTATAQMQVIGKRHYGRKALPPGGGGGKQSTRELFDTLLLWRARVPLDADGKASVEVPLNDSLTAFRIVAVASGSDRFGTGATSIRSTQDLMLFSGLAPLVREGDREEVEFTLRNTTDRAMQVALRGAIAEISGALGERRFELAPGESRVERWQVEVPLGVERLHYELSASDSAGASDALKVEQRVSPAVAVRTFQSTILRWEEPVHVPVKRPADAIPGRGGIDVRADPTLAASLAGVRDWMRDYPYTCLEQKVSRAVALEDEQLRAKILAELPSHLDGNGLLKYFPTMSAGSEVLTAYVVSLSHAAGWQSPPDLLTKVGDGLTAFVEGRLIRPTEMATADLSIRKLAAVEALARLGRAGPALLDSIAIEPNLWPTSAVLDWWSILERVPGIADARARRAEAEQIVRARLDLRGTALRFSSADADGLWWLMVSPETNALRLLLQLLETRQWREDLPRLVRGAVELQRGGAWQTTVANAWGTLAMRRFAADFEATPVGGTTSAALGSEARRIDWTVPGERAVSLPWPAEPADLAVDHAGTGNPWITVASRAAIPLREPLASGLTVTKTVTPIEPRDAGTLARGDRLRVRLDVEAQSDLTWVVVSDPIPAGASHLGTGLSRDSQIAAAAASEDEELQPSFAERSFEAFRAYYEFVPKGRFSVEYVIRLNQSGRFQLPTTRAEALYAPETFGELPNQPIEVAP